MPAPIRALVTCLVVVTASIPTVGGSAEIAPDTDPCAGTRGSLDRVTVPSLEHRTIQSGVCAVQDGGTVHILPGVYAERVTIWGKRVELRGTGNEKHGWPVLQAASPAEVVPAREAVGIISVRAGGSLTGRMLTLVGGDAGVFVDHLSGPVDIRHVRLERNGRGILHLAPEDLTVKHATFFDQSWNGISFAPRSEEGGKLMVADVEVVLPRNMGLYCEGGDVFVVENTELSFSQEGAIVAHGCLLLASHVDIASATKFGIIVSNAHAEIDDTTITDTRESQPDEIFGDAIVVWTSPSDIGKKPASATLRNVDTLSSDRAAVSSFGAAVSIDNCTFACQNFDWFGADLGGFPYEFEEGIVESACGCPDADEPCSLVTDSLEPPEMIGGIEP